MASLPARLFSPDTQAALRRYAWVAVARDSFGRAPSELNDDERIEVARLVKRKLELETRVLHSAEAAKAAPPAQDVDAELTRLMNNFDSVVDYQDSLQKEGLTASDHRDTVLWNLTVERVLADLSARVVPPAEEEIVDYYLSHSNRFSRPERREASHIMLVHDRDEPTQREEAWNLLQTLRAEISSAPGVFEIAAKLHSECPTAMEGGFLGTVSRGKLYPELDAALFSMVSGEVRGPIVTEAGTHLLRCGRISLEDVVPFEMVRTELKEKLHQRAMEAHRKKWLRGLAAAGRS